ncbi:hypothetical protein [Fictibacillus sp. 18YEL24]|uniref:hypothetical protein n=1 Tax=Fictibacillus sp. 18YEL24 TaxID=2745875 RepID=UPI0018CEAFB4|nr:hypothetical protein [Fictibacillus sp. 18YEL24]MBH0171486.1 hypothetical protein [Fictibacillus sp. 18YEL24]
MKSGDKVSYKGKIYIVIHIYESGYLEIKLGDLSVDKESYIEMFKRQAKYFIENKISDPQI